MPYLITPQLIFTLDEAEDFKRACAKKLGIEPRHILDWHFFKRSLDVRHKRPKFQATLKIEVPPDKSLNDFLIRQGCQPPRVHLTMPQIQNIQSKPRACIIGAGPAGLFCAMALARANIDIDIFERGKPVSERTKDVAALMHHAALNPESNICFGEGGAGAFSDGKLMTRTKSREIPWILENLIQFGAQDAIRFEAHPHIGTDRLAGILKNMRQYLQTHGVQYHFSTCIDNLWIQNEKCRGIVIDDQKLAYDAVFLAIGHSADDFFEKLARLGLCLEPKPLAIGVRVEHPQALINSIQYGSFASHPLLPPAEYAVRFNHPNMPSVFSFCMCPGGRIVNSQTTPNTRVVNGMSGSKRNGAHANAALVVQFGPENFHPGPLGGLHAIRALETRAAQNCPPAFAPAQSMLDFIAKKTPSIPPKTTYAPGTAAAGLHNILPQNISNALSAAIDTFDTQMRGFKTSCANFVGIESRTSSPVRITRLENYQAAGCPNLYPIGEGAGYAGGITSCALDGIHAANAWLANMNAVVI